MCGFNVSLIRDYNFKAIQFHFAKSLYQQKSITDNLKEKIDRVIKKKYKINTFTVLLIKIYKKQITIIIRKCIQL